MVKKKRKKYNYVIYSSWCKFVQNKFPNLFDWNNEFIFVQKSLVTHRFDVMLSEQIPTMFSDVCVKTKIKWKFSKDSVK